MRVKLYKREGDTLDVLVEGGQSHGLRVATRFGIARKDIGQTVLEAVEDVKQRSSELRAYRQSRLG